MTPRAASGSRQTLPDLVRDLAIGADTRVKRILGTAGPDGVLEEIRRIKSGWARHVYFVQLLDQANLDSATLTRTLKAAGPLLDSDFARAAVLKKAAERFALDETSGTAYADLSRTIASDFEARQALAAALMRADISPAVAARMVKAATPQGTAGIESDFELAELLQQVPPAVAGSLGQVYLDAVASIGSDFERKRVLSAMARRPGLDASGRGGNRGAHHLDAIGLRARRGAPRAREQRAPRGRVQRRGAEGGRADWLRLRTRPRSVGAAEDRNAHLRTVREHGGCPGA